MILLRCIVLAVCLLTARTLVAQVPPEPVPKEVAAPFAGDERAAKLAERYKAMLAVNPSEGMALDRLWKAYEDHGATAALIDECRREAERSASASAWLIYGHCLKKAGQFDAADAAYVHAAKVGPGSFLPWLARGELALLNRQPDTAAQFFVDALEKLPPNDQRRDDALMKLGNAWLAAGQFDKAAESWEKIVALHPANLVLHKQLAETYAKNHLVDKALAHYEYLELHADLAMRAAALRELGRLHEGRGDFDAARSAYERGLVLTSRDNWLNAELQGALIRLYQRAGRAAELEALWRQAATQTPRDLGGYLRLETLAEAQGDVPARLGWLEKIISLAPRDRDSRLKLARLLADSGQREKAVAAYDDLLKNQPDNLDLIFARADLDLQLGAPEAAVKRLEARLDRNPTDETVAAPVLEFFLGHHLDEPAERCLKATVQRQPAAIEPSIALAKFYFVHRRADDARRSLDALVAQPGGSGIRQERWQRLADIYKDENMPDEALRCWREVVKLSPDKAAPLLAAAELLLARGDGMAAADELRRAVDTAPDGPEREEIERRLFQLLAAGFGPAKAPLAHRLRRGREFTLSLGAAPVGPGRTEHDAVVPDGPLDRYLVALEEAAVRQSTPGNYLRLARWQMWAHRLAEASASAEKAITFDPTNIPARQLLVGLAIDAHEHPLARKRLREIMAIDPARRGASLRQIAGLLMDDGNFDAAIAIYNDFQQEEPGSLEALTDLALAQQRADRWFDAVVVWKRAAALPSLTSVQRADVRHPLVAAFEHLGEYRPAAEMLLAAVDEESESARKQELFGELTDFCGKHTLSGWLSGQYEDRLRVQPDDYFTLVATARLRKERGQEREAFQLLKRAYFSAPDPAAALTSLADEAETLGEDDEAVADRRRLIGMAGQNTAENLEKLADLEETNLDEEGAGRTWEQIAARFPRDTSALGHAAEYFERVGHLDRARGLTERIAAMDPGDLPRLFHLGTLELDAGRTEEARARFAQVLAHSATEKSSDPLRLPPELDLALDPSAALGRGGVFYRSRLPATPLAAPSPVTGDDRAVRLQAIRELAKLLPDGGEAQAARQLWFEQWSAAAAAGARSEPLEAFFSAGDAARTMELLATLMAHHPADEKLRVTFLEAGLRTGNYARLARWAWQDGDADQRAQRGPQLVEVLEQYLGSGGKPGEGMVGALFPAEVRARDLLWRTAREGFAERRWYAQAVELGEKIYAQLASGRAAYAVELAQWQLFLGRADRARAVLREAADEGGGESLDTTAGSPVFEALRTYYLLLPAGERTAFVNTYLRAWKERDEPIHAILSALLLHGLEGDTMAAERDLDAFLALRLTGAEATDDSLGARRWSYLLANGVQLQTWGLGPLAVSLWEKALREGDPFDRLNPDVRSTQAEIRSRLTALQVVVAANPEIAREKLTAYLSSTPPLERVNSLATQLMAASEYLAARQVDEWLTQFEPDNGENWRNLLTSCETVGDTDAVEQILDSLLDESRRPVPALNRAELICRLAMLRENGGDAPGARRLLEKALQGGLAPTLIVSQLTRSYVSIGQTDEAARVWQDGIALDPGNASSYRLGLAAMEEGRGNLPRAISLLEEDLGSGSPPNPLDLKQRLVSLYLQAGRTADARNLALGYLRANDLESLAAIAQAFGRAGQEGTAREWLATAVRRSRDPQARFQFQRQLLQQSIKADDFSTADFLREMRRLKKFAQAVPMLKTTYDFVRFDLARQRGLNDWLESELQREWRGGKGDFSAGEFLVGLYLYTKKDEPLRGVVEAIDHRPNLPETSLTALEERLVSTGHAAFALPILERLSRRFPQNEIYALAKARVLWRVDQQKEAERVLEALDDIWVFHDDLSTQIAALYQELGDSEGAYSALVRAVERDPDALRAIPAYLRLAQRETAQNHWTEARRLLRLAYRNPMASDLSPLIEYLQASGRLDGDMARHFPGDDFPLTPLRRAQLCAMIYAKLKTLHRVDDARIMALAHPALLAASPALTAAVQQDTEPAQVPAVAAALEKAIAQSDGVNPRLNRALAAMYLRWSEQEINGGKARNSTHLEHLVRANQLVPGDLEIARRLATSYLDGNQQVRAAEVLRPFLETGAVRAESEQARQLLARHPTVPAESVTGGP